MDPRYYVLFGLILPLSVYVIVPSYPTFRDIVEGYFFNTKNCLYLIKLKESSDTVLPLNEDHRNRKEGINICYRPPYRLPIIQTFQ
ncbi:hypothetical protein CEXT_25651 [Caerostris extrusa]|uniref:Uncharacterized protein n=1 Tax=Caerostris extrusa TaxID=172846 RepID=A0AAV4UQP3_CAEEX|nr:hypothetical protein CEXT_25651 [Caerostris extrusa]